ncbi:alpha-L-fucosidase [Sphingobacterium cellulitidis]|uniref:alpha-L-fucosidase n=1 Tax=Sphingobacterium cellulitidis TaxID=1768011 RepID=A0A8H9G0R1_9SPHI|nr:alpha-L-fucosidase [Sphingobacterium soli]MBA8986437.1 alpha-L-fucosidase [Sphingobacterium soli]GGE20249.1 hypothetical protein GCM10011516_17350 [Sphingobacterium soli]
MNKRINLLLLLSCVTSLAISQELLKGNSLPIKNTYSINQSDTPEDIIRKAAHVVPTKNQYDALKDEFIAFIHIGPNTFTKMEWGNGKEDPKIFDLKTLDTDQWCKSMKDAGMTKVIFTAKHHDGFVLWQSRYTQHGVMSTGFRNGNGDVLKDLAASCQKFGLKLGIYLSPADLYQIENPDGLYGNLSEYSDRTIPRKVEGRPFRNNQTFKFNVDDYNEYFLNQLFELLTEYGPIHEVWFDGAHPKTKGGQKYNRVAWKELIHSLAPNAIIFGMEDLRWCGNEAGGTRSTEWNVIPYAQDPLTLDTHKDLTDQDLGSREAIKGAKFLHYQPAETNTSIREGWFYRDDNFQKVRSTDDVFDIYERSVGGNSIFLLNIPPNREGKFSAEDVKVLEEVGERIKSTYSNNLLRNAKIDKSLIDGDLKTKLVLKSSQVQIEIPLSKKTNLNRFVIQEAIDTNGERIEKLALDAWIDGSWKEISHSTNVGFKRILRFPQVNTNKLRLRILESRAIPVLSEIGAYLAPNTPPQLEISRNASGKITIQPKKHEFGWKPHGEDVLKNLSADYKIFYTTDGTKPNKNSNLYQGEFLPNSNHINAIAISKDGQIGSVVEKEIGIEKKDWKIIDKSSETKGHESTLMFDENPSTYWNSQSDNNVHFVTIDLGKIELLKSFAYTPQRQNEKGMLELGKIYSSNDGINWDLIDSFEFGNLINDPTTRTFRFKNPVKTKFIKIEAVKIARDDKSLSIAELDFFN